MINMLNVGQATGRLTKDPYIVTNRDGSRRVFLTIAAADGYTRRDGKRGAQFIPVEAFIPANRRDGLYALLDRGSAVSIAYSVRNNNYMDKKSGQMHYGITLHVESIRLAESREAAELRRSHMSSTANMNPSANRGKAGIQHK